MKYTTVCVAGTFDGLHKGHEALLNAAFAHGEHIIVALTSDAFVRSYKGDGVTSYELRKKALIIWLRTYMYESRAEIIKIDDPVGPAASADIDALVITSQNYHVGDQINALRGKYGKKPLVLLDVPLVPAQDRQVISSTRIRRGEIDSAGNLVMPDSMRDELSKPLGRICRDARPGPAWVISVGDMTTKTILEQGVVPNLMIIDNKVNREAFAPLQPLLKNVGVPMYRIKSGPGYIAREAIDFLKKQREGVLEIDGEEDLLVLPAITYAPLGSVLYYGQPGKGMVEVVVTQDKKNQVQVLLSRFIS